MTSYAQAQADLVAALTGTAAVPSGFDLARVEVARKALLRKRAGEVAKHWPLLRAGLGERFQDEFAQWAAHRPTNGSWLDGWDFARSLRSGSRLTDLAAAELAERELLWHYDGTTPPRRRRGPGIARIDGRLMIRIGGRVRAFGF